MENILFEHHGLISDVIVSSKALKGRIGFTEFFIPLNQITDVRSIILEPIKVQTAGKHDYHIKLPFWKKDACAYAIQKAMTAQG